MTKIAINPNATTSTAPSIKTVITHDTQSVSLPHLLSSTDVDATVWIVLRSVEKQTKLENKTSSLTI